MELHIGTYREMAEKDQDEIPSWQQPVLKSQKRIISMKFLAKH